MKIGFLTLGLLALLATGCKKDDDDNVILTKMTANIDGKAWTSTTRVTVKNNTGFVITAQQISTTLVTSSLVININGSTPGKYEVGLSGKGCLATYIPDVTNASDSFISATGSVELTEVNTSDKTISGTFSFKCAKLSLLAIDITNGTFTKMKYTDSSN